MRTAILDLPLRALGLIAQLTESLFFVLVRWYDDYVYSPLQVYVSPIVARIPRQMTVRGVKYDIFTANIVSWARTLLFLPIAWLVKYNYCWTACSLMILHDFLDHVDGIVAKVQKRIYGTVDDPLLGGFMDAFCDKIVNVICLWSLLLLTDYSYMTLQQTCLYVGACSVIIVYEFILGVVRVQDYFSASYERKYGKETAKINQPSSTAAVMEGKLKEKLESMGIAFLCLAQASTVAMDSISGRAGIVCLLLSVRLAHASLNHKLEARIPLQRQNGQRDDIGVIPPEVETVRKYVEDTSEGHILRDIVNTQSVGTQTEDDGIPNDTEDDRKDRSKRSKLTDSDGGHGCDSNRQMPRRNSVPSSYCDGRVDKVYTIGCFDLFHHGHVKLLERMKAIGRKVIVGVHDSRSIYRMKTRVPIDSTELRMNNVKQYADVVFCVAGTDPSTFINCIVSPSDDESYLYIRGDDMPNFPAKSVCERLMPIHFLPYTPGVSSTKLRKMLLNSQSYASDKRFEDDDYSLFY